MRIALCDDEAVLRRELKEKISVWGEKNGISIELVEYGSGEEMLFENEKGFPFDLMILDIQMQGMNGFALAEEIRKQDSHVLIAFVTNVKDYVFQGYEVQAIRYLLKPIADKQLFELLDFARTIAAKQVKAVFVDSGKEKIKVFLFDLIYAESMGHYTILHTVKKDIEWKKNFSDFAKLVKDEDFVMIHRSYIVNLEAIESIHRGECLLTKGISLPISRSSYKAVNEAFINYYRKGRIEDD